MVREVRVGDAIFGGGRSRWWRGRLGGGLGYRLGGYVHPAIIISTHVFPAAHRAAARDAGGLSVGVAAATTLYFTVDSATIFEAIYYKAISFYKINRPWSTRILAGISVIIFIFIFKKFFKLEIGVKSKKEQDE